MHQFFIKSSQVWQNSIRIEGKDVNHIKNVLRMQSGDQILVTDENEVEYLCEIGRIDADAVWLKLIKKEEISRELSSELYLFQCLPKGDKMDLIIEKSVELGVHTVIPVESRRCVVKLDSKKAPAKVKRWSAVAEAAAKQSKRSKIPHIHQVINFAEAIALAKQYNLVCIPYENHKSMDTFKEFIGRVRPGLRIGVFIGPEGGFEPDEIQSAIDAGIRPVSLGNRILRTETAGITMLSMLMLTLECGGQFGSPVRPQPVEQPEEPVQPVNITINEDDLETEPEEMTAAEAFEEESPVIPVSSEPEKPAHSSEPAHSSGRMRFVDSLIMKKNN